MSRLLTEGQLAEMRRTVTQVLPDRATLQTRQLTSDGVGGMQESYRATKVVPCRFRYVGGEPRYQDAIVAAGIRPDQAYIVTLEYGLAVAETDQLVIKNVVYQILTAATEQSWQTANRYLVKKL